MSNCGFSRYFDVSTREVREVFPMSPESESLQARYCIATYTANPDVPWIYRLPSRDYLWDAQAASDAVYAILYPNENCTPT